jgi:phospholipid transport system substrate-binding protein
MIQRFHGHGIARHLHAALLGAWLLTFALSASATPMQTVQQTVAAVLTTLADPALADQTRRQQALTQIARHFDFDGMTRRTLATNWSKAEPPQQQRVTALFRELLINTYWQKLARYRGEKVEFLSEQFKDRHLATVRTVIHAATADIPVDYKLELVAGDWMAYDVVIEQVSLVRNYRGTFLDEVHAGGIDGLIKHLELRVAETSTPAQ